MTGEVRCVYVLHETGYEGMKNRDHEIHGVFVSLEMAMMELRALVQGQERFCPHYFSSGKDVVRVKFSEGSRTGDAYIVEAVPLTPTPDHVIKQVQP